MAFGPFVLEPDQARLTRDGRVLALAGRAFDLLCVLAAHPLKVLDKDSLLDAVWGDREVSDSSLKGAINTLRMVLGDDAAAPLYIETASRRGYRFLAEVRPWTGQCEAQAASAAGVAGAAAPGRSGGPQGHLPDRAALAPPASAAQAQEPARKGNLPFELEPLVGRTAELAQLQQQLRTHRLVTITGLGGVGKTRLALAAAAQWARAGSTPAAAPAAGPAWLLRLDELESPQQLLQDVARSMALDPAAAASAEAMAGALSGERLLLVLDNAEHLVAGVAELCRALLAQAPQVQLMVTSQVPLRLGSEALLPLAPLGLPTDLADDEPDPDSYDAARLLVARIRQHQADWMPGADDAAHLAALCRALDGVPLALELAAARVPLLGLAGVRARLDQRFALLTRGARNASVRHRTLAAALDWTFGLLSDREREALMQLSVFGGSFSIEDCERLLGDDALDVVEELRARSLLVVGHTEGGMLLRLFESVRSHALAAVASMGTGGPLMVSRAATA